MPTAWHQGKRQSRACREVAIWPSARCRFDVAGVGAAGRAFRQQSRHRAGLKFRIQDADNRNGSTVVQTRGSITETRGRSRFHPLPLRPCLTHTQSVSCLFQSLTAQDDAAHHVQAQWERQVVHTGTTNCSGDIVRHNHGHPPTSMPRSRWIRPPARTCATARQVPKCRGPTP